MAYSKDRATPSPEAHAAAEALDSVIESLLDGVQMSDMLTAFAVVPTFFAYAFETGISKGESISRLAQVLSMLERDNKVFEGLSTAEPAE